MLKDQITKAEYCLPLLLMQVILGGAENLNTVLHKCKWMLNILRGFQTLHHNLYNIENGFSDKSYGHHRILHHEKLHPLLRI